MLREPVDITIALTDYFRNYNEGKRLAEASRDVGYLTDPKDAEALRRSLPEYGFTNPSSVKLANAEIDSWLSNYQKKYEEDQKLANQAALKPVLQRYEAGQDTADDRVALMQYYGKDLDNVLKPHSERKTQFANQEFLKGYAKLDRDSYNNVSEFTSAVADLAASTGYPLKPEDIDRMRNSTREYWEKIPTGRDTVTTKVGPETSRSTIEKYALGDSKVINTANDNPANREISQQQIKQKATELKRPQYYTVEYPDGTIEQYNASRADHSATLDEIITKGLGVVSKSDNPESQQSVVYNKETGEEATVTKKVKQKTKKGSPAPVFVTRDAKGNLVVQRNK